MISIMKGVHCQISVMPIDRVGCCETNSTGVPPTFSITQLMTPYRPWNIWFFQMSPITTGVSRNGVISIVRTIPRPKNLRSSSTANAVPSTSAAITGNTVSWTLVQIASRKKWSLSSPL